MSALAGASEAGARSPRSGRLGFSILFGLVLGIAGGAALACHDDAPPASEPDRPASAETGAAATASGDRARFSDDAPAGFVGRARCADCHAETDRAWRGSHHDLAMAGPEALVGDFTAEPLEHAGGRWHFERDGEAAYVRHEDATGRMDRRRVVASFGIEPLQQVLVEGEGGRLHAWPIAWDARREAAGGQRWYGLGEEETAPSPDDPLHRDGPAYEWNSQCAACHSTALRKGYDEATHTYDTHAAEIDVACEACHGPGERHAALAASGAPSADALPVRFEPWRDGVWRLEEGMRIAARVEPRAHDEQLEVCAPCHARRAQLQDPAPIGAPFLDGYAPRLIEPGLYHDDGQIEDEVYVWGSFQQSRMAAVGVRCSDCHDPHTLETRRPGNALCGACHAPEVFDAPSHRGHSASDAPSHVGHPAADAASVENELVRDQTGRACISCHMPTRTYMGVDVRRDHAFPMPRPAKSAALGTPDPCLACHADRDATWASASIARWRGDRPAKPHWSDRLVVDGAARAPAEAWLEIARAPGSSDFVRGSAWRRLAEVAAAPPSVSLLTERVRAGGPLERLGLVDLARRYPAATRARLLAPLLGDARRAIRVAAAEALSEAGGDRLRAADRASLGRALGEVRAVQAATAERPASQTGRALLAARYGEVAEARAILDRAIERAPYFVPARVNRADLARAEGDEATALAQLAEAVRLVPSDARVRRAYGFALHRTGDRQGALVELERARRDAPRDPDGVLAYALALDGLGDRDAALAELGDALEDGVEAPALYHAFVSMALESGRLELARPRLARWRARYPADPRLEPFAGIDAPGARPDRTGR